MHCICRPGRQVPQEVALELHFWNFFTALFTLLILICCGIAIVTQMSSKIGDQVLKPVSQSISYGCALCRVQLNGPEPYEEHINSKKHLNKVAASADAKALTNKRTRKAPIAKTCEACGTHSNSEEQHKQHLESKRHLRREVQRRAEEEKAAAAAANNFAAPAQNGNGAAGTATKSRKQPALLLQCEICGVTSNGPIPHQVHLLSKKHVNRVERASKGVQQGVVRLVVGGTARSAKKAAPPARGPPEPAPVRVLARQQPSERPLPGHGPPPVRLLTREQGQGKLAMVEQQQQQQQTSHGSAQTRQPPPPKQDMHGPSLFQSGPQQLAPFDRQKFT
eukprot:g59333.t1